jgi:hypothetical protein
VRCGIGFDADFCLYESTRQSRRLLSLGQDMRRREFIKVIGGTATVWPAIAMAQQPALPIVAFVGGGTADSAANYSAAFRKGLADAKSQKQPHAK